MSAFIENPLKALCAQIGPGFVRVRRDEAEVVVFAERQEMPRGERADVLVVVADDRRAMPSRQALVFHADEDEGDFRRAECGDGRVVGADAGDDAVRPDQVVGLARQFLGGLQEADVPMDARARVVEEPRQEIAPGGVRQVDGDDDVSDNLGFLGHGGKYSKSLGGE